MKYLAKLLTFIVIFSFLACEEDDPVEVASVVAPPALSSELNGSTIVLTEETSSNIAVTFTWSPADFDVTTVENYELLLGLSGNEFATPYSFGVTTNTFTSITVGELNNLLQSTFNQPVTKDAEDNTIPVELEAKVVASLGSSMSMESGVISFNVVPFELETFVPLKELFFVGPATISGWENNNNNQILFRAPDNENIYNYTGFFAAGEFKILEILGQWQPQWGTNGGNTVEVNDGTGSDPGAFSNGADGFYSFQINLEDAVFSFEAFDASGAADYTTVGYIGSATTGDDTGWNSDLDFTQSSFDTHIWFAADVTLFDGEMKFRAEDDWGVNWGGDTAISGVGTQDGPNIPVAAGTYDIWFNDLDGRYILVPKN
ncbi:SusE domain-containing protein [Flagellimonas meishanensis]|uniref:SusE domain-containing protein n=1 Tax=Flagellimonas meishanensis TaxID=2873264 RepID=UPI001CA60AC5|nr:SusE domain-containing protein [[Muricauda] meishanensis]